MTDLSDLDDQPDHRVRQVRVHEGKTEDGQDSDKWYWQAVAQNGRVIAIGGEPFDSEWNARRAALALFPDADFQLPSGGTI